MKLNYQLTIYINSGLFLGRRTAWFTFGIYKQKKLYKNCRVTQVNIFLPKFSFFLCALVTIFI